MRGDDVYPCRTKSNEKKLQIINLIFDIHDFCVKNILHIVLKYSINEFMHFLQAIIFFSRLQCKNYIF